MELRPHLDRLGRVLFLTTAVAMLVVCALLGLLPLKADGARCGSAFLTRDSDLGSFACDQVRSLMLPFALSALGVAVVFGLAALAFAPDLRAAITESTPVPETGE